MKKENIKKCVFCGKRCEHIYEFCYVDCDNKNEGIMCKTCINAFNAGYYKGKQEIIISVKE